MWFLLVYACKLTQFLRSPTPLNHIAGTISVSRVITRKETRTPFRGGTSIKPLDIVRRLSEAAEVRLKHLAKAKAHGALGFLPKKQALHAQKANHLGFGLFSRAHPPADDVHHRISLVGERQGVAIRGIDL